MMKRWLYHYEIKHALIRLLTLIVVTWCFNGMISSTLDASEPIRVQMTICFILLLLNFIKLTFASSTKYSSKLEDVLPTTRFNLKSTAVKILLLPLLGVMGLSGFVLTGQLNRFQYHSILMMKEGVFELDQTVTGSSGGGLTILVLILSSWSGQSAERRQILRETSLRWTEDREVNVVYRFVVGQAPSERIQSWMGPKLVVESEKYHDLLVVPAPDLRLDKSKKLYEALKWASNVDHDYLVKTDDDVFVRFDIVTHELNKLGEPRDNYWKGLVYR